jgi:hypothetical protein
MLADLDWSEVEALHPHGLPRWPYAKLHDLPSLRRQLARVRRQGYGVNSQEAGSRSRTGDPATAMIGARGYWMTTRYSAGWARALMPLMRCWNSGEAAALPKWSADSHSATLT